MTAFDRDAALSGALDFRLMANTPVTLFWRRAVLESTAEWLLAHGYQVVRLAAAEWAGEDDLHRAVAAALDFPDYYGHNLDALNDCLGDVAFREYGASEEATGLVLVLDDYDRFASTCPDTAWAVLDIFATQARRAALIGHRMACLVRSGDPDIRFRPVGAVPVMWNDAEWLDSARRAEQPVDQPTDQQAGQPSGETKPDS